MIKTALSSVIFASLAATSVHTIAQSSQAGAHPEASSAQAPSPQVPTRTQNAAPPVDKKKVEKFVAAYSGIQEVRADFSEQLQHVQDPEKAKKLQEKAHSKMDSAVEEAGLSVDEYRSLASQINENPALLSMVQEEIAKTQQ